MNFQTLSRSIGSSMVDSALDEVHRAPNASINRLAMFGRLMRQKLWSKVSKGDCCIFSFTQILGGDTIRVIWKRWSMVTLILRFSLPK
jgi:hypothetical protein